MVAPGRPIRVPAFAVVPHEPLHTFHPLWPVRHYPHLRISVRGPGPSGTSTHLTRQLPGTHDDRVGLKTCLAGLRAGDVLVVWKLDRLGRSLSHLVRILEDLKGREVAFRSVTEDIDTTTPHGEFLYNLFGTLAQYERSLIRERVNAGLV